VSCSEYNTDFLLGAFETAVGEGKQSISAIPVTPPSMRISAATLVPQQPRIPVIQRTQSPLSQSASSQSSSPIPPAHLQDSDWNTTDEWDTPASQIKPSPSPVSSTLTMTKEAKAAEMARRKEERKQVIRIFAPEKCKLTVFALAHCHAQRTEESSDKDVNRMESLSASHIDYIPRIPLTYLASADFCVSSI